MFSSAKGMVSGVANGQRNLNANEVPELCHQPVFLSSMVAWRRGGLSRSTCHLVPLLARCMWCGQCHKAHNPVSPMLRTHLCRQHLCYWQSHNAGSSLKGTHPASSTSAEQNWTK